MKRKNISGRLSKLTVPVVPKSKNLGKTVAIISIPFKMYFKSKKGTVIPINQNGAIIA